MKNGWCCRPQQEQQAKAALSGKREFALAHDWQTTANNLVASVHEVVCDAESDPGQAQ